VPEVDRAPDLPVSVMVMPKIVELSRVVVHYSGTSRDFYVAQVPEILPGVGPTAELAVADVLRNFIAART
jgi:hypothetical protein